MQHPARFILRISETASTEELEYGQYCYAHLAQGLQECRARNQDSNGDPIVYFDLVYIEGTANDFPCDKVDGKIYVIIDWHCGVPIRIHTTTEPPEELTDVHEAAMRSVIETALDGPGYVAGWVKP